MSTDKNNEPITMQLTDNGGMYTRWPCSFCGGCTEKVSILCEADGLRACEFCLKAGQDALNDRMRSNAEEHEAEAARLRSLIGRVKIPTYAEWEAAEEKYEAEERRRLIPEGKALSVEECEIITYPAKRAAQERTTMEVDEFGGCPTCGKNNGYVNAGATHVFYCSEHKVSWIYGANIFSGWREETKEQQRENYKLIEDFERVVPWWPEHSFYPCPISMDISRERIVAPLAEKRGADFLDDDNIPF
jgi:hypothetical protein